MKIHVVQCGDSLYKIAFDYGVSMSGLIRDNQLEDPSQLVVGQTIVILYPKQCHTVQIGETLGDIAEKYQKTIKELLQNNPQLEGWETIHGGQHLVVDYETQPQREAYVTAYAYPFIDKALLHQTLPYLSTVTPFTYRFDLEGTLFPLNDGYIQWAGEKTGVNSVFHIASVHEDGSFSTALSNVLLENEQLQDRLISQIQSQIKEKNYVGVDVDFELIDPNLKEKFPQFLEKLKKTIGNLPLTVAVSPKTSREQAGIFYEGHSYESIGKVADKVLLMTYEWGFPEGEPMAIAPIYGVKQVLDYAITEIPPEKLLLGLPTYGYDWKIRKKEGEKAKSLSTVEAVSLAREFHAQIFYDDKSEAPYFHYTDNEGEVHCVWFDDARSMSAKLDLIQEYGLQGGGYWNLDRPFPQNWLVLHQKYKVETVPPQ